MCASVRGFFSTDAVVYVCAYVCLTVLCLHVCVCFVCAQCVFVCLVFSFLPREQPACPLNQNVTQSRAEDLLQPSTCLQQLRSEIREGGRDDSDPGYCNAMWKKKEWGQLVCIDQGALKLITRHGRLNSVVLDFLASWNLLKNIGIACYDPNTRGSSNLTRQGHGGQKNMWETSDGMCMIFPKHGLRPLSAALQAQSV